MWQMLEHFYFHILFIAKFLLIVLRMIVKLHNKNEKIMTDQEGCSTFKQAFLISW
jgi:hypothetical protein